MDLRPRKKQKNQDASASEAANGQKLTSVFQPAADSARAPSTKRKYRAPSDAATSTTASTFAPDHLLSSSPLPVPSVKRTRYATDDTSSDTHPTAPAARYHLRQRTGSVTLPVPPTPPKTARSMPKSRSVSLNPPLSVNGVDLGRGREKKAGGELPASSNPAANKKEKKQSSRSTSASTSKQTKDSQERTPASTSAPSTSVPKSRRGRRKDLRDPELGEFDPDLMHMEYDQEEDLESPIDEHHPATLLMNRALDLDNLVPPHFPPTDSNESSSSRQQPTSTSGISAELMRSTIASMRGLQGLMSNVHGTLKTILPNLRNYQDPTMQHIALQEFAELLAISTEETLQGYLSPEPYVVELIKILKGGEEFSPFGENPDTMLLACRCLANLMEALPQTTGTVVYSGAVPVLCSKLLEIQYIDLAEQALSTLEKISIEYPTSIVREGGLTACLMYLDFFSTNVQRTAVTTAANCCRNIPFDCFATVSQIMPNLKTIISGTDQKVVEQGCICLARLAEGFKNHPEKLEQLISTDVLQAVLTILLPGSSFVAGSSTFTQLLKLLGLLVKNSAKLGVEMLRMNLVDTVYQILTGLSPPDDMDMDSKKKTSIFVLQALIHRPHTQILETLNIICDLFPDLPEEYAFMASGERSRVPREERKKVLDESPTDVVRFSKVLVPTLLDIYSSTIIFAVRQRVVLALLKITLCLDRETLRAVLSDVPLASFLAGMLSQRDHAFLVLSALHLAELLSRKLPEVYRLHFQREGIIAEVEKIVKDPSLGGTANGLSGIPPAMEAQHLDTSEDDSEDDREPESDDDLESPYNSPTVPYGGPFQVTPEVIKKLAKSFLQHYSKSGDKEQKEESSTLRKLRMLGQKIVSTPDDALKTIMFTELARYFEGDLSCITTYELLESGILEVLLSTLSTSANPVSTQRDFLRAFAERHKECTDSASPLEILVTKLQELLSRSESFDVVSVSNDGSNRHPAAMLAKQIRVNVVAEDKSSVPKECQSLLVTIHAISKFHLVAQFLRNKIVTYSARPASFPGSLREPELLRNLADRRGALEFAQLAQEMGFAVPPSLARRVAAMNAAAAVASAATPTPNSKAPASQPVSRRSSGRLRKDRSEGSRTRATASDPELEDMENDEELLDAMEEDEQETEVAVEVPTPTATPSGSRSSGSRQSSSGMSYATALQQTPQDWHLELEYAGHMINLDSTVFEPFHKYSGLHNVDEGYHRIFLDTHTIKYRKVPGPLPAPQELQTSEMEDSLLSESSASSGEDTSASVLKLLQLLHSLSVRWDEILLDPQSLKKPDLSSQFVNTKLTAKLNRQLEEPLLIASNCLPTWSQDLARHYPFLFPFETRYLFVQSTSFGYSRCMNRWVPQRTNNSRADRRDTPMGRQQRSKLRLQSRENFLRLALNAMYKHAGNPSILEMEYQDEVGTGLGPTLEFYANTSKEFARRRIHMWRENDASSGDEEFLHVLNGFFPAPLPDGKSVEEERILYLFGGLGRFVARSMLDSRIIDIHFNPLFFRLAEKEELDQPSILSLRAVDKRLFDSLKLLQRFADERSRIQGDKSLSSLDKSRRIKRIHVKETTVEDLALDFTLPGYSQIELKPGGRDIDVTIDNVREYVDLVVEFTIGRGIRRQIDAFKQGFSCVFPYDALRAFTSDELVMVFGKSDEDWCYETLVDCVKADHGFNIDSRSIRNLLEILNSLSLNDRRTFLQFLTGSPKLPIGGFKKLLPPFTVVCRPNEPPLTADDYLPSVMTCANYLKLPDYSSKEVMRQKIFTAMTEGSQSFHLS